MFSANSLPFKERKMKEYRISISETIGGNVWIRADSEEEAIAEVERMLDYYGVTGFDYFDVQHKETFVHTVEEEK